MNLIMKVRLSAKHFMEISFLLFEGNNSAKIRLENLYINIEVVFDSCDKRNFLQNKYFVFFFFCFDFETK